MKLIEIIGKREMLLQTAEEAVELAQACLKMARKISGKNPTPLTMEELQHNLEEEVADVCICIEELQIDADKVFAWVAIKKDRMGKRFGDLYEQKAGRKNI
jgi:NTP pyrophosphatase (non-canonical NTP hydrolase)